MGDQGTCAFCGYGEGYLLEQGDESSQVMHSAVRTGTPPDVTYKRHENAWDKNDQYVTWCGHCVGGLIHKYERYDDTNLHAAFISAKVRLELDGLRWSFWEEDDREKLVAAGHVPDDQAIHADKLRLRRDISDMQNELFRRAGVDLTQEGWRP